MPGPEDTSNVDKLLSQLYMTKVPPKALSLWQSIIYKILYFTASIHGMTAEQMRTMLRAEMSAWQRARYTLNTMGRDVLSQVWTQVRRDMSTILLAYTSGVAGGFGEQGRRIAGVLGGYIGKSVGEAAGGPAAGAMGKMLGKALGSGGMLLFNIYDSLRMIGAKYAPLFGPEAAGRTDYRSMGLTVISRTAGIQQATAESRETVLDYATRLARVGQAYDLTASRILAFSVGFDKLAVAPKGTTIEILTQAVSAFGEAPDAMREGLLNVYNAARAFRMEAERTNNPLAKALGATNTLLEIYKKVGSAAAGSALSMNELSTVTDAVSMSLFKMGLRPGAIKDLAPELVKLLSPKMGTVAEMYTSGFFVSDVLARSGMGQQMLGSLRNTALAMGDTADNIMLALQANLTSGKLSTAQMFRAMVLGFGDMRDTAFTGELGTRNMLVAMRMQQTFGISPPFSKAILGLFDKYQTNISAGYTPDDAWTMAIKSPTLSGFLPHDVTMDQFMTMVTNMARSSLSWEQSLQLTAQTLVDFKSDFWPTQKSLLNEWGDSIVNKAVQRTISSLGPAAAFAAEPGHYWPRVVMPSGHELTIFEVADGKYAIIPDDEGGYQTPTAVPQHVDLGDLIDSGQAAGGTFVAGTHVSTTADGVRQVDIRGSATQPSSQFAGLYQQFGQELGVDPAFLMRQGQVESAGRARAISPAGALGPGQIMPRTWRALLPRVKARFPNERLSIFNPKHNIYAQTLYMRDLLSRAGGNYPLAASWYNAGPRGNVNNPETRAYRQRIFGTDYIPMTPRL